MKCVWLTGDFNSGIGVCGSAFCRNNNEICTAGFANLGVHSLSLERETSTNVLATFSWELANFKREFANVKRKLAEFKRSSRP